MITCNWHWTDCTTSFCLSTATTSNNPMHVDRKRLHFLVGKQSAQLSAIQLMPQQISPELEPPCGLLHKWTFDRWDLRDMVFDRHWKCQRGIGSTWKADASLGISVDQNPKILSCSQQTRISVENNRKYCGIFWSRAGCFCVTKYIQTLLNHCLRGRWSESRGGVCLISVFLIVDAPGLAPFSLIRAVSVFIAHWVLCQCHVSTSGIQSFGCDCKRALGEHLWVLKSYFISWTVLLPWKSL